MIRVNDILSILPINVKNIFPRLHIDFERLYEIRLRTGMPVMIVYDDREYFLCSERGLCERVEESYTVSEKDIRECMEYVSNYSLYAYEEELRQGFITVKGGHRVGVAGKTVCERDNVKNIKYISCINIRVAHECKGCSDRYLPYLIESGRYLDTLIISPPRCGKTTFLRDIVRNISNGNVYVSGKNVGVVDERSEIGACYRGVPGCDVGIRTDILDNCPKALGMMMLIRSMSPDYICVDEIGGNADADAISYANRSGCNIFATVHGVDYEDISRKAGIKELIKMGVFKRFVVMDREPSIGHISCILNQDKEYIYSADEKSHSLISLRPVANVPEWV